MVDAIMVMLLGIVLSIALIGLGVMLTLELGKEFVTKYVTKITPEDYNKMCGCGKRATYEPIEEALWARDMSEKDVDGYYKED